MTTPDYQPNPYRIRRFGVRTPDLDYPHDDVAGLQNRADAQFELAYQQKRVAKKIVIGTAVISHLLALTGKRRLNQVLNAAAALAAGFMWLCGELSHQDGTASYEAAESLRH